MALVIAIMHLYNIFIFYIVSVYSFFLSPGIDKLDGMVDDISMSSPYVLF